MGDFADGQLRHHQDIPDYVTKEIEPKEVGEFVINPTFELDGLPDTALEILGRHAPQFGGLPNRVFISGRAIKHIAEQRRDLLPNIEATLGKLVRTPEYVLPNPTQQQRPWARPWLIKHLDSVTTLVVEVRANGRGIDVVNVIAKINPSRLNKAERLVKELGLKLDELAVYGDEGRSLPEASDTEGCWFRLGRVTSLWKMAAPNMNGVAPII